MAVTVQGTVKICFSDDPDDDRVEFSGVGDDGVFVFRGFNPLRTDLNVLLKTIDHHRGFRGDAPFLALGWDKLPNIESVLEIIQVYKPVHLYLFLTREVAGVVLPQLIMLTDMGTWNVHFYD